MNNIYVSVAITTILIAVIIALIFVLRRLHASESSSEEKSIQLAKYASIIDAEAEAQSLMQATESTVQLMLDEAKNSVSLLAREAQGFENDAKKKAQKIVDEAVKTASLLEREAGEMLSEAEQNKQEIQEKINGLRSSYSQKKRIFDDLEKSIAIYKDDADFAEVGIYEPHFDFDSSEKFKDKIRENRNKQKAMLRNKDRTGAIWSEMNWTIQNSRSEGKKMITRAINLTARAFNGECDAAVANCTFKNRAIMSDRIKAAFSKINALNEVTGVLISNNYLNLKLEELDLVHSYKMKKQNEREEQREIRAQMAEERKAQQEIERAVKEAEAEELRAQKALEKARKEMVAKLEQMTAEQKERYQSEIETLQDALAEAKLSGQKAISMAQQTKRGHVYIISNLGSFGENVFKIGMTRRLDPQDRVDELGSASVPFLFDVHAMIHCEDAPALENALHQYFDSKRTNLINRRKEFFNVSLDEIKLAVSQLAENEVDFIETVAAQHYYETLALRKQASGTKANIEKVKQARFADAL